MITDSKMRQTPPRATDRKPATFLRILRRMAGTFCAALPVPIVLVFFLIQIRSLGSDQTLGWPLYQAVWMIVPEVTVALLLAATFRPRGLAEETFEWSPEICRALCRNAWTMALVVSPLLGATVFFRHWEGGAFGPSMGRFALMASMFVLGQSMWGTANMIIRWVDQRPKGVRTFWFAGGRLFRILATGIPMLLVFLAAIGFQYAAEQLGTRMVWTVLAGSALLLLAGLVFRMVDIQRTWLIGRIVAEAAAARQLQAELVDNTSQVMRLVQIATVAALALLVNQVWADVLPMGSALDQFRLWQSPAGGSGEAAASNWITLRHLLLAGMTLVLTLLVSRNVPGFIQIMMPGALPLDRGGRYAITFVARYLVVLTGLVQVAILLGFAWARVQWLVAGLTVGLGFGLQEVFANLVSGLIILMERPIRVGDYVSVNNVTGTVTRMALRATTIQDADRREWIVPNRKFITDDVMNWTLSDTVSRAVFPICVTHGSNTLQVQKILLVQAKANPNILDYPEPSVVLSKIGGVSLDFELRVFLPSRTVYAQVQNDLLVSIEREFRANGIELELPLHEGQGQDRRGKSNRKVRRRKFKPEQNSVPDAVRGSNSADLQPETVAGGENRTDAIGPEELRLVLNDQHGRVDSGTLADVVFVHRKAA